MGGKGKYELDSQNFSFRKKRLNWKQLLSGAFRWILGTLSLAIFYYAVLTLFFSTPEEKRLMKENRMYEEIYEEMASQNRMNADAIKGLQVRDNEIYKEIFHAAPPSIDPAHSLDYAFDPDTIDSRNISEYAAEKSKMLMKDAAKVDENFIRIFDLLERKDAVIPPMSAPLENLNYAQIGASVGQKINPFIKVETLHSGLDLLVGQGTPVLATADGKVEKVIYSRRGQGNVVEISHPGGYLTRYTHLTDIKVSTGRMVRRGDQIGEVGISGKSFAPHLHYEVWHDGEMEDPVNYLFTCLDPSDYANVLYMAVHTEQSLD